MDASRRAYVLSTDEELRAEAIAMYSDAYVLISQLTMETCGQSTVNDLANRHEMIGIKSTTAATGTLLPAIRFNASRCLLSGLLEDITRTPHTEIVSGTIIFVDVSQSSFE